ncbi:MAG: type II toxin-antitoxin system HicB family antitoxin [Magnetococcales bacterium]|nr:type II toxin-antitoxin system HicB family antitoxin [Magnetococcales bacterium]MBF0322882.1 type II toxin-antitoxin system HicB family antitoxin [Magnetococcales bacterium]
MSKVSVKIIPQIAPSFPFEAYAHTIAPLSPEEGGGFLITFPDLPGCMADGETVAETVMNGRDAFASWVSARMDCGKAIPKPAYQPGIMPAVSGRFVTRLPKSIHAKLAEWAKAEGVSLNTLVLTLIAEGLGRHDTQLINTNG